MYALGTLKNHGFEWSTAVGGHPSHFHSQTHIRIPSVVGSTRRKSRSNTLLRDLSYLELKT